MPTGMGKLTVAKPDGVWDMRLHVDPNIQGNIIMVAEALPANATLRAPPPAPHGTRRPSGFCLLR